MQKQNQKAALKTMRIPQPFRTLTLVVAMFTIFNLTGCASTTNNYAGSATNTSAVTNQYKVVTEQVKIDPPEITTVTNRVYVCGRCGVNFTPTPTAPYCPLCVPAPCVTNTPPATVTPPAPTVAAPPAPAPAQQPVAKAKHRRPLFIQIYPRNYYKSSGTNSSSYSTESWTE